MEVAVLGIGNSLMGDDAVGLYVARKLAEKLEGESLPGLWVEVTEAPGGLDAVTYLLDRDRAIIIDAVIAGGSTGQVVQFGPDRIPRGQQMAFSLHGFNLADALNMSDVLYPGRMPRVLSVVGVEIGKAPRGVSKGPSPRVCRAVPEACRVARDILSSWVGEEGA